FGTSNISLPNGRCRPNSTDCSAHSVEYDVASNSLRPLMVLTNVWCSSGTLMPDGTLVQTGGFADGYRVNLFIFANNRAILFDYSNNLVVKTYPTMPGGQPKSYPSTGSAVLLPFQIKQGAVTEVEVLVCGGAPKGAFVNANRGIFDGALDTCGRIKISDVNPQWIMETMPFAG
nr:hypothetical protein [Tanacetum cinerariifolium]